jgi:tetratricopeptide (TPR) repeat protein
LTEPEAIEGYRRARKGFLKICRHIADSAIGFEARREYRREGARDLDDKILSRLWDDAEFGRIDGGLFLLLDIMQQRFAGHPTSAAAFNAEWVNSIRATAETNRGRLTGQAGAIALGESAVASWREFGDFTMGLRTGKPLCIGYGRLGWHRKRRRLLEKLSNWSGGDRDARWALVGEWASTAGDTGAPEVGIQLLSTVRVEAEAIGDRRRVGRCHELEGRLLGQAGKYEEALVAFDRGMKVLPAFHLMGDCLRAFDQAKVYGAWGKYENAKTATDEAVRLAISGGYGGVVRDAVELKRRLNRLQDKGG